MIGYYLKNIYLLCDYIYKVRDWRILNFDRFKRLEMYCKGCKWVKKRKFFTKV